MNFHILTIFPDLFEPFKTLGLVGRGQKDGLISITTKHLRDYAINNQGQIDDTPYGGGSGMVLRVEPGAAAIREAKEKFKEAKVIAFSPRGKVLTHAIAKELAASHSKKEGGLILLCPRYEGVDERVLELVDEEISLGDFVLMGGEVAAMALIESVTRFIPGVLGNEHSTVEESFSVGLLEYPQYTKPQSFEGKEVPEVLLSGNHKAIENWRKERAVEETRKRRPDLLPKGVKAKGQFYVGLVHYPVWNNQKEIIASSITNLDLHDIARSSKTYGVDRYYVIHPTKALRRLAEKIMDHWEVGYGATFNPNRSEALRTIALVTTLDDAISEIERETGRLPKIITTSAQVSPLSVTFKEMQAILVTDDSPHLFLLGTGWGLAQEVLSRADYHLEPVLGPTTYNHLSVRAAAAIMFDRLFGRRS